MGTGPSCAGALDCGPAFGRVCAIAALETKTLITRNNAKIVRLDMKLVRATSGPAWADARDDQYRDATWPFGMRHACRGAGRSRFSNVNLRICHASITRGRGRATTATSLRTRNHASDPRVPRTGP